MSEDIDTAEGATRTCEGCGRVEDAGAYPDQDGLGRSECCWDDDTVEYIDIRPTVEGTKAFLAAVARDPDDERVLWGLRFARACGEGWLEWYGEQLSEARGWKD